MNDNEYGDWPKVPRPQPKVEPKPERSEHKSDITFADEERSGNSNL